jgi:lipid-A-disaccharide synthase
LANILAGRGIVPEFIQHQARAENILPVVIELIEDSPRRIRMVADLRAVRASLGAPGASKRAAGEILDLIRKKTGKNHG